MTKKNQKTLMTLAVAAAAGAAMLLMTRKSSASVTPPVSLTALTQLYASARISTDRVYVLRAATQMEQAGRADLAADLRQRAAGLR